METDDALYRRYLDGDEDALGELMERHGTKLTLYLDGYLRDLHEAELAKQYGVDLDEHTLAVRSEAFAIRMGGRSARVAKQFIELCKSGVQV